MIKDPEAYQRKQQDYQHDLGMLIAAADLHGDITFLQQMVDEGKFDPLAVSPNDKWNYLHKANIWNPSPVETIRFYLDKGVEVNAQDIYGNTPLYYALRIQNGDAAMALLEAGANPNIPNCDNIVPLGMAVMIPDRLDVIEKMLQNGGDVHYLNGNSGLDIISFLKTYFRENEELKPIIAMMEKYA